MANNLTLKEKQFVNEYLWCQNATEAAFWVYNCKNRNVAGVIGWENLRKPKILQLISQSLEPVEVNLVSVAKAMKHVLETGSPKEKLRLIEIYYKAIGAI